ncbi:hypothetical protein KY359_04715, partial [Candidatus Woesearchaeota archaeon]|nr:hypothetical protein [Candidatus Woesearchaeota archaeon]
CMDVIHHSSNEAKQLKESRAEFREIKKAADASIANMRKEIGENLHGLERAKKRAEHSGSPKAHEEANLLGQRQSALSDVNKRLGTIDGYVDAVLNRLAKINLAEDKRIQAVDAMNDKAERHKKKVEHFQQLFLHNAKELKKEHQKFSHLFKEGVGEIPDEQLLTITDSTVLMFQRLETLAEIAHEYNAKELKPLIAEMAEVLKNLKFLSEVSEYLTKMYYKMSKGMEELTKMAAIVDPNPESKKKLTDILNTEGLEEQLTKRAYRKGKVIVSHIQSGYKSLVEANSYTDKHVDLLDRYLKVAHSTKHEVGLALNEAFKVTLKREIKQAKTLEAEAARAQTDMRQAQRAEFQARGAA